MCRGDNQLGHVYALIVLVVNPVSKLINATVVGYTGHQSGVIFAILKKKRVLKYSNIREKMHIIFLIINLSYLT